MNREKLYIENVDRIFHLLLKMVRDREEALDLTQDAFYRFFKKEKEFRGEAEPATYLYRIAINLGINYIRKRKLQRKLFVGNKEEWETFLPGPISDLPDRKTLQRELDHILTRAMIRLPSKQAQCFFLSKIAGLPQKEIAKILQISVSAVESNVFRAKKELAKILFDYLGEKKTGSVSNKNEKRREK
jgi:RNA polymerase sigma-70 factor (ECF subfamily)